ncbi:MAG: type II secretion system major pseudopilin GspG [Spirochaetaceae bacterium]
MNILRVLSDDGGWTFVETVITVGIILVLSSTTGVAAYRYIDDARRAAAKGELTALAVALDSYAFDCGEYPTTEQGLIALYEPPYLHPVPESWNGPYLNGPASEDPWGRPYVYRRRERDGLPYELYSLGPPGEEESVYLYEAPR